MKSIYFKIEQNFDFFSKAEKKVAKYCIDNYATIGMHSLAQVSKNSQSGEQQLFVFVINQDLKASRNLKKNQQTKSMTVPQIKMMPSFQALE